MFSIAGKRTFGSRKQSENGLRMVKEIPNYFTRWLKADESRLKLKRIQND